MKKSQEPTRAELEQEAIDIIMRLEPAALERLLREFKATMYDGGRGRPAPLHERR